MDLIILFIAFFTLLLLGLPIAFALGVSSLLAVLYIGMSPVIVLQKIWGGLNIYALMTIPFFIFAGELMRHGGIAKRLINFSRALLGRLPGHLGPINILSGLLFGGVSGSAVADASALGAILIPEMQKQGYDDDYAVNVNATSSITALLIPPSQNMIIYSIAAGGGVALGDLFLAGVLPGILTGLLLLFTASFVAYKRGYSHVPFPGLLVLLQSFIVAIPAIITALIIVVGIRTGLFTPVESSVITILYAALVSLIVYRSLDWPCFVHAMRDTLQTTALIMFIIATASAFGWVLSQNQVPSLLLKAVLAISHNRIVVFLLINALLIVLGTFMDMSPLIIICTPIFLPLAEQFGMSPVQFGVMLMLNLGIGLITPPVGSVLFVSCAIAKTRLEASIKGAWPFYSALLVSLLAVTFIPWLSLWGIA